MASSRSIWTRTFLSGIFRMLAANASACDLVRPIA